MGLEAKYTVPLVGVSSAASRCSSVLFPAPEGATIATISPRRKLRFASVKTVNDRAPVPYVFLMLRASSTTGASGKPLELPAPASAPALVSKFILGPHSPLRMAANLERPPTYFRCRKGNSRTPPGPLNRAVVTQITSHLCRSLAQQEIRSKMDISLNV